MKEIVRFFSGFCIATLVVSAIFFGPRVLSYGVPTIVLSGDLAESERHVLAETIQPIVDESGNWVSSFEVAQAIDQFSWTEGVRVWRTLPNTLHVEVGTKQVVATLNAADFLSDGGEIVSPVDDSALDLPTVQFDPEETHAKSVASIFDKINEKVERIDESISSLDRTSEGWKVTLESGATVILGDDDVEGRFERFLAVYVAEKDNVSASMLVADARYDHGVALKIRKPSDESTLYQTDDEISSAPLVVSYQ